MVKQRVSNTASFANGSYSVWCTVIDLYRIPYDANLRCSDICKEADSLYVRVFYESKYILDR